jgi:Rps23 Pro-64 3,4-dihydroxylase Tpa1-like proline 4-hydroxylase
MAANLHEFHPSLYMNTESRSAHKHQARSIPWKWIVALLVIFLVLGLWWLRGGRRDADAPTFAVRRGPLNINVLEGGSVRAVESQEVKCEVRVGYQGLKILKLVEEGYEVTTEDIRTNKVLIELDSSEIQKQIVQQDIQFETAAASLTDAQQNYEIQLNQNLSDIKAAEQKVRFARMDFDKFLGDTVTERVIARLGLESMIASEGTNSVAEVAVAAAGTNGSAIAPADAAKPAPALVPEKPLPSVSVEHPDGPAMQTVAATDPAKAPGAQAKPAVLTPENDVTQRSRTGGENGNPPVNALPPPSVFIDFAEFASIQALGDGEAKQKLRKFEDDLQVAKKEQGQSKANLEGTKRLFDKGFVTRVDLEKDEIASENSRLKVQTAETARELYLKYEFQKTGEETLSKYSEAARELVRARKAAVSKLAQAQAKLKSAQGQYNIQSRQRKELYEQLEKCHIKATKPGLVVYGNGGEEMFFYGGEERIREGATVRERQSLITIPDMSRMSVRVKIHESYIRKIKKGQKATITVDAFPDKVIQGEVTAVGVLPDSQNMWMNPDMKVYLTTITLSGTNDWLKPGMNAKVDILVNRLENVMYVPLQAVSPYEGKQVCYLGRGRNPERRVVETGEFNDEFIEIKAGLKEGELVLLRPAEAPSDKRPEGKEEPKPDKPATPEPAAPAAVAQTKP